MTTTPIPHQRHNVAVNLLDAATWLFGISFMSATTILPVFLRHLTDSPLLIGLIPALIDMGWFLPQLFIAPYLQNRARVYGLVVGLGFIERLPFIAFAVVLWFLPALAYPSTLSLVVFFGLLLVRSVGSGIVAPPWQELIARIIPVSIRGRFFSAQQFVGNILALGGAALAAFVLARYPYPTNFIICFSIGAASLMLSWFFLALSREPDMPVQQVAHQRFNRAYVSHLLEILRIDQNFRAFLMSRACAYMGTMALGFLAISAVTRFHLSDAQAAIFNTLLILGGLIGNMGWGTVADRIGYKAVLNVSTWLWIAALIIAFFAPSVGAYYVIFVLVGIAGAGTIIADLGIVMEFGTVEERPTYIGLARTATAPFLAIAPLLGGLIAQFTSYRMVMLAALPFAVVSLYILQRRVREPRHLVMQAKQA